VRPPRFWAHDTALAKLLSPFEPITRTVTRRRLGQPGWRAAVPVICCGNVTVGGAGKTTVALDLGQRLRARGIAVQFLTRGYGGRVIGPHRVDPVIDTAEAVGDEPLLLAAVAPTWVGADRAASARAALAAGAELLLMDDGLQNPTLDKSFAVLVIDGATGFGNRRLLPAGPLREPVAAAAARCGAAILIGDDATHAGAALPPGLLLLRAQLRQSGVIPTGRPVVAFAGIGFPGKFWASLDAAGAIVRARHPFPDHHRYTDAELSGLLEEARRLDALLVTTPKDAVRLPADVRAQVTVCGVSLVWDDPAALETLLDTLCGAAPAPQYRL
jgi:tetraacyldisaccharide 4'-kinase